MQRGDLFLVNRPDARDPKPRRAVVIVSRQGLIDSNFGSVICAPIYSRFLGVKSQILVGIEEGLKHESAIYCDDLISLPKSILTHYLGKLDTLKLLQLSDALCAALDLQINSGATS
jgi:mRNA interferase MazF